MPSNNTNAGTSAMSESPDALEKNENVVAQKTTFFSRLTEDWWAVIIGGIIVTAILLFAVATPEFKFSLPVYQWSGSEDLLNKVLSAHNLLLVGGIGVVFLLISSISISLSGNSAGRFIK